MINKDSSELHKTLWVAKTLWDRGKVSGSTANISIRLNNKIYISATNSCFGNLTLDDFSILDNNGNHIFGPKPSKELTLHLILYKNKFCNAVIHTHSFYSTLISCTKETEIERLIPKYTPYLQMKIGNVVLVDYKQPGTKELFNEFANCVGTEKAYLLKNHGSIVWGENILSAFYGLEELEESCKIAFYANFISLNIIGK